MPSTTVPVGSAAGLHARPAALIAEEADKHEAEVTIGLPDGHAVDASSSLMLMTLGAGQGDHVVVSSDDEVALAAVVALVERDLD